jgi:hypothetical protein
MQEVCTYTGACITALTWCRNKARMDGCCSLLPLLLVLLLELQLAATALLAAVCAHQTLK